MRGPLQKILEDGWQPPRNIWQEPGADRLRNRLGGLDGDRQQLALHSSIQLRSFLVRHQDERHAGRVRFERHFRGSLQVEWRHFSSDAITWSTAFTSSLCKSTRYGGRCAGGVRVGDGREPPRSLRSRAGVALADPAGVRCRSWVNWEVMLGVNAVIVPMKADDAANGRSHGANSSEPRASERSGLQRALDRWKWKNTHGYLIVTGGDLRARGTVLSRTCCARKAIAWLRQNTPPPAKEGAGPRPSRGLQRHLVHESRCSAREAPS